jgi:hypothetical protein
MNQALYAHMTNKRKMKKKKLFETDVPNILKLLTDNESHYENENQPEFISMVPHQFPCNYNCR